MTIFPRREYSKKLIKEIETDFEAAIIRLSTVIDYDGKLLMPDSMKIVEVIRNEITIMNDYMDSKYDSSHIRDQ